MPTFTAAWSDAIPAGSLAAADLDQAIRDLRRDIHERMNALFGLDWTADPLAMAFLAFGVNPAASGLFRVPNNQAVLVGRNAANTADIILTKMNALNQLELAAGKLALDSVTGATIRNAGAGTVIGAVATPIYTTVNNVGWAFVVGTFGAPVTRAFYDIVGWEVSSAQVSSTVTLFSFGVPGARTYSIAGSVIQLAIVNSHTVKVVPFEVI